MLSQRFLIRTLTLVYASAIAFFVWCASNGWYRSAFAWVQTYASDKLLHFVLVGILTLLVNLSLNLKFVSERYGILLWGTGLMLALATLEEVSQIWISNRTFDLSDLGCNYLGILTIGNLPLLFRR